MKCAIRLPHFYDIHLEVSRSATTYHSDAYRPWAWVKLGNSATQDEPGRWAGRRLWFYWPIATSDNQRKPGWPAIHFDIYVDRGEREPT